MSRSRVWFSVALPLLALLVAIVGAERRAARSRDFVFDIEGYDPRDLLRGRYLQFRLRIAEDEPAFACANEDPECCLCLGSVAPATPPRATRVACSATAGCDGVLRALLAVAPLRFYVPEAEAAALERRLSEAMAHGAARAVIGVDRTGSVRVRGLRLDGADVGGVAAPDAAR